ncbi:MAG: hypothetical protein COA54_08610 [Thiotrichaceae bacterium]|nr:MAG: hypothetical protein COA54_08610 [Thiotrichaceae bacterium]
MKKYESNKFYILKRTPISLACASAIAMFGSTAYAVEGDAAQIASNETLEEVISLGTRSSRPRTASDSTVPIDSISGEQFRSLGNAVDITDNLKAFVPSFTATPATGDGSAFVRPTSLRGLAPDQTLVLVNGKRRHRSALVHFFAPAAGNGAHGVDIGMIPSIALKRVDVLRDGASSQYGSDAIAGVMNFVMKDASEGGSIVTQYGQFYEGESSWKVAANSGIELGDTGFLNLTVERVDNEGLSRGVQRPDAQALIDAGVIGVGSDSPFDDAPFAQSWGRPATDATRFFLNGGAELTDNIELYFFGNYAETDGTYRFFYRNPGHSTLTAIKDSAIAQGGVFTDNIVNTGYTPYLQGEQIDISLVTGLRGELDNGWDYDFSIGYGQNELDYTLHNTTNPTLGVIDPGNGVFVIPQRNFDVGAYVQTEINVNLDFSKLITETVNLAYGFEWREETYETKAGEVSSYIGAGSNGFAGINPAAAGEFDRDNYAAYIEVEKDFTDDWLVQAALRYEDFSDFGDTINGKLATRYNVNDSTAIRGSVSTGFHAPTPGQANITTVITTFDGSGNQQEEGLVVPTSAAAAPFGGKELEEETSVNLSMGLTTDFGESSTLTVDVYQIDISDRIYRTGNIPTTFLPGGAPDPDGPTISFYTNALDIQSSGIDLVYSTSFDVYDGSDLILAANFNDIDVTDQNQVNGVNPVSDATVEDIENNYPDTRFVLTSNTSFNEEWNLMVRANYYGKHFDERGTIDGAPGSRSAEIDPVIYIDMEVGYHVTPAFRVVLGGSNIFDEFVDEIEDNGVNANRQSVGLQYPRRTAANYEGGSWYLAAHYEF